MRMLLNINKCILIAVIVIFIFVANSPATATPTCVNISGNVTYVNGTSVGSGETVAVYQSSSWYNTTTNATGGYTALMLEEDVEFTIFPEKLGYTSTPISYTLYACGNYTLDLFLTEEDYESTAIGGIVYLKPYYEVDPGLNVSITNGTFTDYNLTTATGFYIFYNLTDGEEYTFSTSAPDHDNTTQNATKATGVFTQNDLILNCSFNLTVNLQEVDTFVPITSNVTLSLSTGGTGSTTSGSYTFTDLDYNFYTVTATSSSYYSASGSILLDSSDNLTIYMTPLQTQSQASSVSYTTQHEVRMVVQNKYGTPLPDTWITITPTNTTLGNWSWINDVFGYPATIYINNSTLSGQTDYVGGCDFLMLKETRYLVNINNTTSGVDENYYLFPKDDLYIFTVGTTETTDANNTITAGINWTLTNTTVNATHENLTFTYTDPSGQTTNLSFWVKTQSSPISTCYQKYCADSNSASETYTVASTPGSGVVWGFDAISSDVGNFSHAATITFRKLVDLGIAEVYYGWIAAAFLILLAGFFSVINVRFGAIVIPCFAYFLWWIKWLSLGPTTGTILGALLIIAVISYIRKAENKI